MCLSRQVQASFWQGSRILGLENVPIGVNQYGTLRQTALTSLKVANQMSCTAARARLWCCSLGVALHARVPWASRRPSAYGGNRLFPSPAPQREVL